MHYLKQICMQIEDEASALAITHRFTLDSSYEHTLARLLIFKLSLEDVDCLYLADYSLK